MSNIIKSKWAHLDHTSYSRRTELALQQNNTQEPISYILIAGHIEIIEIDGTLWLKYAMEHASSDVNHLA